MATLLENLMARRDAIGEALAELAGTSLDSPDAGGPLAVERVAKIDAWHRELASLNQHIAAAQGFVEVDSYAIL